MLAHIKQIEHREVEFLMDQMDSNTSVTSKTVRKRGVEFKRGGTALNTWAVSRPVRLTERVRRRGSTGAPMLEISLMIWLLGWVSISSHNSSTTNTLRRNMSVSSQKT
jgi:hypothetical protein